MKLVLASSSPRRREILKTAGIDFEVRPADINEELEGQYTPQAFVETLSLKKALAVPRLSGEVIIGADTVVAIDGEILGKPKDSGDARRMLTLLSGKTHSVFTGASLVWDKGEVSFCSETRVSFYELSDEEILNYILTREPFDKAGAYGIQGKGCLLVSEIQGDYFNVMGLPAARLIRELTKISKEIT